MADELVTLDALIPDPKNARLHTPRNVGLIVDALHEVGAARSIVIDEDGVVLAGNATVEAAAEAGLRKVRVVDADGETVVAVRRTGLTPEQKTRLALFDNRAGELAAWDPAQLQSLPESALAGLWSAEELGAVFDTLRGVPERDPDDVPSPPVETTITRGEIWALGPHRVMCGDAASADDLRLLLDGRAVDALFTSPPYNVEVGYQDHDDDQPVDEYLNWVRAVVGVLVPTLAPGRAFMWNIGAAPRIRAHEQLAILEAAGLTFLRQYVWHKQGVPVPSYWNTEKNPRVRYVTSNYVHELVYVCGTGKLAIGAPQPLPTHPLEHDVVEIHQSAATKDLPPGPTASGSAGRMARPGMLPRPWKAHPAAFPVALPVAFLTYLSGLGECVLDPFGGSGTTVIACEQLGRHGYAMDITPNYVQLMINRWQQFTGQTATRLR